MLGCIIGDFAGSCYEFDSPRRTDFELFPPHAEITDDSILSIATAEVLLKNGDYARMYQQFALLYPEPMGGYGMRFQQWARTKDAPPYNSWGNGSAMRVSPVGLAKNTEEEVLHEATLSASVTHDHPEGIKGAQATSLAVFMARTGASKQTIRSTISTRFGYAMDRSVESIRPSYGFNESCQETVPEAIIAFLDSTDFESAIRLSISLGGDSDTLACITGGIAEAYYKEIPTFMTERVLPRIPPGLRSTVLEFQEKFPVKRFV
jgi:ADP-ribosyl-[dinitrogen reductase] hydrolase